MGGGKRAPGCRKLEAEVRPKRSPVKILADVIAFMFGDAYGGLVEALRDLHTTGVPITGSLILNIAMDSIAITLVDEARLMATARGGELGYARDQIELEIVCGDLPNTSHPGKRARIRSSAAAGALARSVDEIEAHGLAIEGHPQFTKPRSAHCNGIVRNRTLLSMPGVLSAIWARVESIVTGDGCEISSPRLRALAIRNRGMHGVRQESVTLCATGPADDYIAEVVAAHDHNKRHRK